jgi:hypothetical protein
MQSNDAPHSTASNPEAQGEVESRARFGLTLTHCAVTASFGSAPAVAA